MLHSIVYLSNIDSSSTITYQITIFNNSDALKQFKKEEYTTINLMTKYIISKFQNLTPEDERFKVNETTSDRLRFGMIMRCFSLKRFGINERNDCSITKRNY